MKGSMSNVYLKKQHGHCSRAVFSISSVLLTELCHKRGKRLDTREGHGVVDGGAHAADAAVSLDAAEVVFLCLGDECLFEFLRRQAEGDVHARAAVLCGVAAVESVGDVDGLIEESRFLCICLTHGGETAALFDPAGDFADDVDGKDGRRVVEGVVLLEGAVAQHGRQLGGGVREELFFRDVQYDAGGAEVFLHARIDEVVGGEVPRAREHVGRHVGKEGDAVCLRCVVVLRAVDGVVEADVEVCRTGRDVQLVLTRDADVVLLLGGGGDGADAEFDGLLVCLLGEGAGEGVAAGVRFGGEVQRDEGKGLAGTAGGKDDVIVVAEPHQFFDVRLCLLVYFVVGGGAVADLEDGHACAVEVEHLALDFFQDVLGQDGGAGVKVIDTFVHFVSPSMNSVSTIRTAYAAQTLRCASGRALVRLNTDELLNALRLNEEIRRGVPRPCSACSTKVCFGVLPSPSIMSY